MTIVFISNFLNHHQLPLCLELMKIIGNENFCFIACEQIHAERRQMGYEDMNQKYSFVLRAYESEENYRKALQLTESSDVAIIGSANGVFARTRAKCNKQTFLFRERIFKNGSLRRFIPTTAWKIYQGYTRYRNKNFYILCASAYAAEDFELCGFPRSKCLKWGYFPLFKEFKSERKREEQLKIMWCGRMLWWKHPEHAIAVAQNLKKKKVNFKMLMVGNGAKEEYIKTLIRQHRLESHIILRDFMSPEEIRENMELSDVYLFTSGREEGWGVVLNEAMNSRCAIIANTCAGSTNYLLDHMNGFLYDGTQLELSLALEKMQFSDLDSYKAQSYERIKTTWNPRVAAENLIKFINTNQPCKEGPCSLA